LTTNGTVQLSSGALNMLYVPNNPVNLGAAGAFGGVFAPVGTPTTGDIGNLFNPVAVFPTATGVNAQATVPCGYRCSVQSDTTLVNILWEQSDTSEDRVYVRQMKVDVTAATPAVTFTGGAGELENGSSQVQGNGILLQNGVNGGTIGTVDHTSFDFVQGDAAALPLAFDLGIDSNKKAGGLLLVFAKTTDATTSDGSDFNRDIIAVQWDGSTLSNRTVIDRGIFEGGTTTTATVEFPPAGLTTKYDYFKQGAATAYNLAANGTGELFTPTVNATGGAGNFKRALHTNMAGGIQVPASNDIAGSPSYSAKETYIYFVTPTGDSGQSNTGLFTRTFNNQLRLTTGTGAAANIGDQMVPAASTGPASTTFKAPQRMDHLTGGNIAGVNGPLVDGTTVAVIFGQDGHLWLSGTSDGATQDYTTDGKGSADPFLLDNDTSALVIAQPATTVFGDSKCNTIHKSIVWFTKNDINQNGVTVNGGAGQITRLRLRTFN